MPSALETRAAQSVAKESRTARDVIIANGEQLEKALGGLIPVDHFIRGALTVMNGSTDLQQVTEPSLMAALLLGAQLGLEIGNGLNQFHLTPRDVTVGKGQEKRTEKVCVPIIGYQGYVALAYRHVRTLDFNVIRVGLNDEWEEGYDTATGKFFHWRPRRDDGPGGHRGTLIASRLREGGMIETWLTHADIEARRPAYSKEQFNQDGSSWVPNTPWKTNWMAMADKTVMREHQKYLPKSVQMQNAIALDGRVLRRDEETQQLTAALAYQDEFGSDDPEETSTP